MLLEGPSIGTARVGLADSQCALFVVKSALPGGFRIAKVGHVRQQGLGPACPSPQPDVRRQYKR